MDNPSRETIKRRQRRVRQMATRQNEAGGKHEAGGSTT